MSIMGGLVGSQAGKLAEADHNPLALWVERNAWAVILMGSLAFWMALGAVLVFG